MHAGQVFEAKLNCFKSKAIHLMSDVHFIAFDIPNRPNITLL